MSLDSIEFRVVHNRNRNDNPEKCKTIARIEESYMKKLGISSGDIVKVSGKSKTTFAICYELDADSLIQTNPEPEVEYLDDPQKKAELLPMALLNGPVLCNVDPAREWQQVITISKTSTDEKEIPEAQVVTLATMDLAQKMLPQYHEHLDYSEIMDFVITKDDRIHIPFEQNWLEKKQQEWLAKQDDPKLRIDRKRFHPPPMPNGFDSLVLFVQPEGKQFWKITQNTKFELQDSDMTKLFAPHRLVPKKLVTVIPISKQLVVGDTEFTIPSMEVYANTMKLIWYSHQRIKIPDADFEDPQKINQLHEQMHHHDSPRLSISVTDDLGNQYIGVNEGGGGGGSSGPDPTTREIVSDFSWSHFFSPALDSKAKDLIITIKEIHWLRRNRNRMRSARLKPTTPPHMTPIDKASLPKIIIAEGPWEYRIPIH